jgi:hypothetical protein
MLPAGRSFLTPAVDLQVAGEVYFSDLLKHKTNSDDRG